MFSIFLYIIDVLVSIFWVKEVLEEFDGFNFCRFGVENEKLKGFK